MLLSSAFCFLFQAADQGQSWGGGFSVPLMLTPTPEDPDNALGHEVSPEVC